MSQENVGAYKRGLDAFNRRDVEAWLEVLDPEVEMHLSLSAMFGREETVIRGHDELLEFLADLDEAFAEFQIEISEIRDLGERLVTIGHLHGRGTTSGADVDSPIGYVVDFKDGKVVRLRDYFDPKEALEAAGLRE